MLFIPTGFLKGVVGERQISPADVLHSQEITQPTFVFGGFTVTPNDVNSGSTISDGRAYPNDVLSGSVITSPTILIDLVVSPSDVSHGTELEQGGTSGMLYQINSMTHGTQITGGGVTPTQIGLACIKFKTRQPKITATARK